jgi:signal transduction histidine kinase
VGPEADSLARSLRILAATVRDQFGIKVRFHYPKPVAIRDRIVANHLYRIVQEGVNNAVKHSGGSQITIGLVANDDRVIVAVKDNGAGSLSARPDAAGIGLQIMRYRAHAIRASLVIQTRRQGGLEIACSINRKRNDRRR